MKLILLLPGESNSDLTIGNRFSELAKKYFISPVARTKLALDSETLKKLSTENKERSATSKLLSRKQQ